MFLPDASVIGESFSLSLDSTTIKLLLVLLVLLLLFLLQPLQLLPWAALLGGTFSLPVYNAGMCTSPPLRRFEV